MKASTTEVEVGHVVFEDEAPATTNDDNVGRCHLRVGNNPVLCGEKNPHGFLDMSKPEDREVYVQNGNADVCICSCIRCQTCITLYEAFKELSWE